MKFNFAFLVLMGSSCSILHIVVNPLHCLLVMYFSHVHIASNLMVAEIGGK